MRSSVLAIIFIFLLTMVALSYSSNLLILKKGIEKSNQEAKQLLSNKNYLTIIPYVLDNYKDKDYDTIYTQLKRYNSRYITVELVELSSKINPNFVDFTLFKDPPLSKLLRSNYTWKDLYKYRLKNGLLADISGYYEFFEDEIDILTSYNLPNINNASDEALEMLYVLHTQDESKAYSLRDSIIKNRTNKKLIDDSNFNSFLATYSDSIKRVVTTVPTWNVNYINEKILRAILSKKYEGEHLTNHVTKIRALLLMRDNEYIDDAKLKYNLYPKKSEQTVLSYLGTRTTFWQILINDTENNIKTSFIFKWSGTKYILISLTQEELIWLLYFF